MHEHFWQDVDNIVGRDFINVFCGGKIGEGMSRVVYKNRLDPTTVIKVERDAGNFQNVVEYMFWQEIQWYKPMAKWYAPVVSISPCGIVLIQKKVEPTSYKDYPKKVPAFFRDIKHENFGMLDGKLVCFDYGTSLFSKGFSKKLKKADWGSSK